MLLLVTHVWLLRAGLRSEEIPVRDGILACSATAEAPVVVFVSKMFAVDPSSVPAGSSVGDGFIGFARVLSGVLKPDSALFVMGPKYIPTYSQLPPLLGKLSSATNSSSACGEATRLFLSALCSALAQALIARIAEFVQP